MTTLHDSTGDQEKDSAAAYAEALRRSEERYRALVDAASQIVWTNTAEGEMRGPQPGWCAFTGQSEAEVQGYGWSRAVHPDDAPPTIDAWNVAVQTRSVFTFAHRVRRYDGVWRTFAIRAVPILKDDGTSIREWVGIHTDITEQKERERRERFLNDLSERTRFLLDPNAVVWETVRAVGEFLSLSRYMYADVDTDAETISVYRDFCRGEGVSSVAGEWPLAPWGKVVDDLAAGRTVVNLDYATDPRTAGDYETIYKQTNIRANVTVPLLRHEKWVGVFSAQMCGLPRDWTKEEVELLETVAQKTWLSLENARLYRAQAETAARQRRFIREMLFSLTEGRLRLCETADDLPASLSVACDSVPLSERSLRRLRQDTDAAAEEAGLPLDRQQDIKTAVSEAAMNAVVHAGGGVGQVHWDAVRGLVQVWVRDEGKGITDDAIHKATLERGYSSAGTLGHGFWMMLRFADRVYLLTGPSGTTVVLEQERAAPPPAWIAESQTFPAPV